MGTRPPDIRRSRYQLRLPEFYVVASTRAEALSLAFEMDGVAPHRVSHIFNRAHLRGIRGWGHTVHVTRSAIKLHEYPTIMRDIVRRGFIIEYTKE